MSIAELAAHAETNADVGELVALLDHHSAMVREAAVFGLARHLDSIEVHIRRVAESDPSPAVSWEAREVLEGKR